MSKSKNVIHPIRNQTDYDAALALVEPYFDHEPAANSEAGAYFEALVAVIEAYEARRFPIAPPDPIDAIKFHMAQRGMSAGVSASHDRQPFARARNSESQASLEPGDGAPPAQGPGHCRRDADSHTCGVKRRLCAAAGSVAG